MSRYLFLAIVCAACNSSSAPTPTKTESAPTASAQSTGAPEAKSDANGRHFGAAFSIAASEPLSQVAARIGKPEAKDGKTGDKGAQKGAEHSCGGEGKSDKVLEGCGAAVSDESGQKVRVRGTVASVCQKAGCWLVLEDGTTQVRIFTREHQFFLPKDVVGKQADVEGTLRTKTLSSAFAKHLAEDGGKDPSKVPDAPQQELMMTATGVAISG
jgi:hypothetical protein